MSNKTNSTKLKWHKLFEYIYKTKFLSLKKNFKKFQNYA